MTNPHHGVGNWIHRVFTKDKTIGAGSAKPLEKHAGRHDRDDDHGDEAQQEVSGHVLLIVVAEINAGCQLCQDEDIGKDDNQFLFEVHTLVTRGVLLLEHGSLLHQILLAHIHDPDGHSLVSFDHKGNAQNITYSCRNADFRL